MFSSCTIITHICDLRMFQCSVLMMLLFHTAFRTRSKSLEVRFRPAGIGRYAQCPYVPPRDSEPPFSLLRCLQRD
jgi:hypothetical protein